MTSAQYKRANSTVFPVIAIIYGYVFLTMLIYIASYGVTGKIMAQTVAGVLALIVSTVIFVMKKDTKMCGIVMLGSATVAYVVILFTNGTPQAFAYAFLPSGL